MPDLKHDRSMWISVGQHRKDKGWKQQKFTWSQLVTRLSQTVRTAESYKEYISLDKDRQSEIKDVGGFVGGTITGGRRLARMIQNRSLITLDVDYDTTEFWENYQLFYSNAACIYSTHKHSAEHARLRLVIPLDREVFPEQYQAIARRIAGHLNIEVFDDTTFQPERLMYWPSTPRDATFFHAYQDGPILSANSVLRTYRDWKDSSQWPVSSRVGEVVKRIAEKQGDPLEKTGVIGAFCRTYSIVEAIGEFLDDVYEETDKEDRYTYVGGSTAAGLILYEDKFAYSHHGTDPISGKLVNAFDLVRIHKFGKEDEECDATTPVNKRPSYKSMCELAVRNKGVSKELSLSRMEEAGYEFSKEGQEDGADPLEMDWLEKLTKDSNGNIRTTSENVYLILKHDPVYKGCFAFNAFEMRECAMRDLPWRSIKKSGEPLTDKDDSVLRSDIEKIYGITGVQKITDAFNKLMVETSFHPVKEYLQGLTWDGNARIDSLLIDYFGSLDNKYTRATIRKTLIAAVARVMEPGCKFDNMLVLVGPQGKGKSEFFKRLGGPWFSDTFGPLDNLKMAMEQLQGSWIIEIGELAGFHRSTVETIKHFISKAEDRFREAYGKRVSNFLRQCIFVGTTNKEDFLNDPTGDRRFWPVKTHDEHPMKNVFKDLTAGEVRQIWAEAMQLYTKGEPLILSREVEALGATEKQKHTEVDEREAIIAEFLTKKVPDSWKDMTSFERQIWLEEGKEGIIPIDKVCVLEIWSDVLGYAKKDFTPWKAKFIRDYFSRNPQWVQKRVRFGKYYGVQRGFVNELLELG